MTQEICKASIVDNGRSTEGEIMERTCLRLYEKVATCETYNYENRHCPTGTGLKCFAYVHIKKLWRVCPAAMREPDADFRSSQVSGKY